MVDFRRLNLVPEKPIKKKKRVPNTSSKPPATYAKKRFSFSGIAPVREPDEPDRYETDVFSQETPAVDDHTDVIEEGEARKDSGARELFHFRNIDFEKEVEKAADEIAQSVKAEMETAQDPDAPPLEPLDVLTDALPSPPPPSPEGEKRDTIPEQPTPETTKNRNELYDEAAQYLQAVFRAVGNRRGFSLHPGFQIIHKMVEGQLPNDPLFISAIHHDSPSNFIEHHSVNTAIFSIKMAQHLEYDKDKQVEIGMAALIHDVGVALIPREILFKQDKLSQKEIYLLRKRPNYAFKILQKFGEAYTLLAETALQIYERYDGSGYPKGIKGDEIHEYAQIIGLVNVYEALVHSRPQREKFLHFTAVKEIIRNNKKGFQRKYLKALLNIFSIFPLSSYVRLNSNAVGRVIETYPDYPMRPKVQIVFDSQNQRVISERIVDLSKETLLYIVDAVADDELKELSLGQEKFKGGV